MKRKVSLILVTALLLGCFSVFAITNTIGQKDSEEHIYTTALPSISVLHTKTDGDYIQNRLRLWMPKFPFFRDRRPSLY
ncbi:MAG: hypothetical protein FWE13_00035 [Firmicutes bacterium]|nr:hypothetical protein [Bacillota bacterium]